MNRNMLYLVSGALVVIVVVLGAYLYRQQTKPEGVELKIDDSGISIQKN
jgi:RsiW-degrading membrane proteinase PrsW (M82 family)